MSKFRGTVANDIDPKWFDDGEAIRVADEFVVDLMFNACGETYQSLNQYKQIIYIDSIPIQTVSVEGLLLTKQTVREKDVLDRGILEVSLARIRREQADQVEDASNAFNPSFS